ncbi:MAG: hypothetical protein JXB34_14030 [Bacteroidales bacterium]|nr:hypothetical protein [Bacteroidales bacterium]
MIHFSFRIKNKLLIVVITTTAIIFGAFLYAAGRIFDNMSKQQSMEIVRHQTGQLAEYTKNYFDKNMGFVKAFSNAFQYRGDIPQNLRDTIFGRQMLQMLVENPGFISVWASLELEYYKEGHENDYGRKLLVAMQQNGLPVIAEFYRDMDGRDEKSDYSVIRANNEPVIAEPYIDSDISEEFITSIIHPIHINGNFAGIGGIDIPLSNLQEFIGDMNLTEGAFAYIISNTGIILGHSDTTLLGRNIAGVYPEIVKQQGLMEKIRSGTASRFTVIDGNKTFYTSVVPFTVEGTSTPWAISISRPLDAILKEGRKQMANLILLGGLGLSLLFSVIIVYARSIAKPLKKASRVFSELADGNLNEGLKLNKTATGDSLELLSDSVNKVIDNLHRTVVFAQEIETGNLNADYEMLSEKDVLGKALLNMRQGLLMSKQIIETGREMSEKESWVSTGLAQFAGYLRSDSSDFKEYCRNLISKLVHYTNANLGGLYLVNSENSNDKHIYLAASYAYNHEMKIKTRIEQGEGLIGASIAEKSFKHMKDAGPGYLKLSSGFGETSQLEIVIALLIDDEAVVGCIELASIKKFDGHHIQFIKGIAESFAGAFISIEMHKKTNMLLEKTQLQTEEMMAKEEELRQNMEEMMATQEEMLRKEEQLKQIISEAELLDPRIKKRLELL